MTIGIQSILCKADSISVSIAKWCVKASERISKDYPDFIVGRSGLKKEKYEDDNRTLALPLPSNCPKCYAVFNETGGITFMLAEEY